MKRNTQKKKKKIQWKKVMSLERFNLHQSKDDPTLYSVRWTRLNDVPGNRRFHAANIEQALKVAPDVAGLNPIQKSKKVHKIVEAFNEALSQASRGAKAKQDWKYAVRNFLKWLAKNHADCRYWHLISRQIIREYLAVYDGKSDSHRRLSLQPIIQTSGYMHREHEHAHFAAGLRIGSKLNKTPPEVYLADVIAFCDFVKERNPRIEAGVALQGLVGLQLQEATRLTWDKVNLEKGLIEISGRVKNQYRKRVIPVADRVLEALKRAESLRSSPSLSDGSQKVVSVPSHVLLSPKGCSFDPWWENYSKEVVSAIKAWNPKLSWTPKDLRNCLPTFATIHGVINDIWEQYLGHVPRSVTARHYIPRLNSVSKGEEEALERQMAVFRLQVVNPLNHAIQKGGTAEILNFFELMQNNLLTSSKNDSPEKDVAP